MKSRITPRIQINPNLKEKIGEVFRSNCFPTFRGRLISIQNERCYFVIEENHETPKYNSCVGNIEYLPESMVVCLNSEYEGYK